MRAPDVTAVPVPAGGLAEGHLAPEDFADAYALPVPPGLPARAVAAAVFSSSPGWGAALMGLRNVLVAPLGLVATRRQLVRAAEAVNGTGATVGFFPLLAETPDEVVMGLDDRHLDFRVSVRVEGDAGARRAVVVTRVRFHGALGRAYFLPVRPVHRVLVPAMMRRAACRLGR